MIKSTQPSVMRMQGRQQRVTPRRYLWLVITPRCFKLVTLIINRLKTGCGRTGMMTTVIGREGEAQLVYISCVLHNTFNVYRDIMKVVSLSLSNMYFVGLEQVTC